MKRTSSDASQVPGGPIMPASNVKKKEQNNMLWCRTYFNDIKIETNEIWKHFSGGYFLTVSISYWVGYIYDPLGRNTARTKVVTFKDAFLETETPTLYTLSLESFLGPIHLADGQIIPAQFTRAAHRGEDHIGSFYHLTCYDDELKGAYATKEGMAITPLTFWSIREPKPVCDITSKMEMIHLTSGTKISKGMLQLVFFNFS